MSGSPILWAVGVLLTASAALAVYRVVRGPTILDRMIASDVLLTAMMLSVGTEMVIEDRDDLVPVLLVLACTAAFATVAVARSVSKHDRREPDEVAVDPLGTVEQAPAVLRQALRDAEQMNDERLDADDLRPTRREEP
ncbi:monovalent cation/H+ antiporter complex subunit F [Amnibacterium endophyticum]|uniref:Monovalent cation/H+ antiporter complex subunit F n=1 Tax=Amnibacterium endophyticum TaxID=2109337 RepID=A0ABW4LKE5_9MICO